MQEGRKRDLCFITIMNLSPQSLNTLFFNFSNLSRLSVQLLGKRGSSQKFPLQLKVYVLFITNCISRFRDNRITWTSIPTKGKFLNWQMKKFTETKLVWPNWLQTSDDHQGMRHLYEGPLVKDYWDIFLKGFLYFGFIFLME